ncbi:MAG: BlaI/MecI/CopY family transcriptional regulator [Pseudomonadota bacterium]
MLDQLPPRERQIVDLLYEKGPSTTAEISEALPDELSGSAIRAMLSRLEKKGFVQRTVDGRQHRYSAALPEERAKNFALRRIVRVFFGGSSTGAATALLGMSDDLTEQDLDQLEDMIAKARKKGQS